MKCAAGLRSREWRREYSISPIYVCEFCVRPIEVIYDYEKIEKRT